MISTLKSIVIFPFDYWIMMETLCYCIWSWVFLANQDKVNKGKRKKNSTRLGKTTSLFWNAYCLHHKPRSLNFFLSKIPLKDLWQELFKKSLWFTLLYAEWISMTITHKWWNHACQRYFKDMPQLCSRSRFSGPIRISSTFPDKLENVRNITGAWVEDE